MAACVAGVGACVRVLVCVCACVGVVFPCVCTHVRACVLRRAPGLLMYAPLLPASRRRAPPPPPPLFSAQRPRPGQGGRHPLCDPDPAGHPALPGAQAVPDLPAPHPKQDEQARTPNTAQRSAAQRTPSCCLLLLTVLHQGRGRAGAAPARCAPLALPPAPVPPGPCSPPAFWSPLPPCHAGSRAWCPSARSISRLSASSSSSRWAGVHAT